MIVDLQLIKLSLQVSLGILGARPSIFEFRVEPRLHLCLLKQHLFSDLIDRFLVLDSHRVCDTAYFFPSLAQFSSDLLLIVLAFVKARVQFLIDLAHFSVGLTSILQLAR